MDRSRISYMLHCIRYTLVCLAMMATYFETRIGPPHYMTRIECRKKVAMAEVALGIVLGTVRDSAIGLLGMP